jgi:hypothetical protein
MMAPITPAVTRTVRPTRPRFGSAGGGAHVDAVLGGKGAVWASNAGPGAAGLDALPK